MFQKKFTLIHFYLENNVKDIFTDYIEDDELFISIDLTQKGENYWLCKLLINGTSIKNKYFLKINQFRKNCQLSLFKMKNNHTINHGEIYFNELEDKNWLNENIQKFKPVTIGNFIIYDNNYFKLCNVPKKLLKINASYAFGTGHHYTTRHCIQNLCELSKNRKFKNILDLGSGSGILGIASQKIMPKSNVTYVDVDKLAVKMTKFNIKKNNIPMKNNVFKVSLFDNKHKRKSFYDLVFANILFPELKHLVKQINYILNYNGFLIISGILNEQKSYLINLYRNFSLYPVKITNEENWTSIIFIKK